MKTRVYLTGAFFAICVAAEALAFVGKPCEFPNDWLVMESTNDDGNSQKAMLDLNTATISTDKPFSFNVALCSDENVKPDRVTASAYMPAHQHGMNYHPSVSYVEKSNSFKVKDFLFHMPGIWEITVTGYFGEVVTRYTRSVLIN